MTWKYHPPHTLCPFPWFLWHVGNIQFHCTTNHFLQDTLAYLDTWNPPMKKWCHLCESAWLSIYPHCPRWPTNPSRIENAHPAGLALSVGTDISTTPSLAVCVKLSQKLSEATLNFLNLIKLSLIQEQSILVSAAFLGEEPAFGWLARFYFK